VNTFQTNINAIVSGLYQEGLRHIVICPGSRNAPLIMAFVRFKKIKCYSIPDERSAGFIALGISKALQQPVAIVCTSGSALLNIYPAVSEAFYFQIPLIVISADRPAKYIDRWDGQTIKQFEVFGNHVLGSFQIDENIDKTEIESIFKITEKLWETAFHGLKGPVHLNVPLREPLYDAKNDDFIFPENLKKKTPAQEEIEWEIGFDGEQFFKEYPKVLVLLGADENFEEAPFLSLLSQLEFVVVCADVISNEHHMNSFQNWETIILKANETDFETYAPDLLITSGKMILSKKMKQIIRKNPPKQHWHIAENNYCADPFFTNPQVLAINRKLFFEQLLSFVPKHRSPYFSFYKNKSETLNPINFKQNFNELGALETVLNQFSEKIVLHLANSMTIRNISYLMTHLKPEWKLFANRGVSGIDGCTSTALGYAMVSTEQNFLITGDVAFFYDINAFYNQYIPQNLKVILMNNYGGGIFDLIEGTESLAELDPFIKTPHQIDAKHLASHFKINYFKAENYDELNSEIKLFLNSSKISILEIKTNHDNNTKTFKQLKYD